MSLTPRQVVQAIRYNAASAERVGWLPHYRQVAGALGIGAERPTPKAFCVAVGAWQDSNRPLSVDGKIGPNTWAQMRRRAATGAGSAIAPDWLGAATAAADPVARTGVGPAWLQVAQGERLRWDRETRRAAEVHMSRDEEYFQASPYFGGRVKDRGVVPPNAGRHDWCAAFANWCLHSAGYSHTGSAGAHSFIVPRLWAFTALPEPRQGCVVVVGTEDSTRGAHVGFLWSFRNLPSNPNGHVSIQGRAGRRLELLGGNQGQRVSVKNERRRMLACRDRQGVTSPYLWPERGAANCNHLPASDQGHFCGRIHAT